MKTSVYQQQPLEVITSDLEYSTNSSLLDGDLVWLRAYTRDDLERARSYINDPQVGRGFRTGVLFPLRPEDETKFYESLDNQGIAEYSFAIELKSQKLYIGGCGVFDISTKNRCGNIAIFLGHAYWGHGYATDALTVLINFCFDEMNLNKLGLAVISFNTRALRCYERLGFTQEGRLRQEVFRDGVYYDKVVMGLLCEEWQAAHTTSAVI